MNRIVLRLAALALAVFPILSAQAQRHQCSESRMLGTNREAMATLAHTKRMHQYDVKFYKLDVSLERTSLAVGGKVTINALTTVAQFDTFAFELYQTLLIDSVRINGMLTPVQRTAGDANAIMPVSLPAGVPVTAEIYYRGTAPSGSSAAIGNGLSNASSPSWGNQVTWSLSQPFSAYEWWPCKQVLTDKADSVHVFVTTNNQNKVGSNGLLTATVPLPGNKVRYEWKSRYPIAYYLISVAVAKYVDYTIYANPVGAPQPIPIQNYIYDNPQTLPYFLTEINKTAPMLEYFSSAFGLYPFNQEKYGHAMAPLGGGMEHQTMTTQGSFNFTLTAHELGHQWFGDHVTCASWSDIWLNEGFASYMEYLALNELESPAQARTWMNSTHSSIMSQPGGSVYVADTTNVNRIFSSRLSYDKGAALVHMLRFQVNNDPLFFSILQTYLNQFGNGNARTSDLKHLFETMTGQSYTDFFNQWFYGQGFPTFAVRWNQVGNQLVLRSTQSVSLASATPLFKTPMQYKLIRSIGDTTIRVMHNQAIELYQLPVGGTVTNIQIDPNQWVVNGTGSVIKDTSLSINSAPESAAWVPVVALPNPFTHTLMLRNLPATATIEVSDMLGRVVLRQKSTDTEVSLSMDRLTKGVYMLKVTGAAGQQVLRVVKE